MTAPGGRISTLLVISIVSLLAAGCGSHSQPAAARVGSVVVTRASLDAELAALKGNRQFLSRVQSGGAITGSGVDGFSPQFIASVLTTEIDTAASTTLLARDHATLLDSGVAAALTSATFAQTYGGLSVSSFPASYRSMLIRRTAVDIALEAAIKRVSVTPSALLDYRNAHPAQFETFCVSAILRPTRASAAAIAQRVTAGASFAAEARTESQDPSESVSGRLGCGTSGMFDAAFTSTLTGVPVGAPSAPVHDPNGWYIVEVTKRTTRSLDAAAPDIVNALLPDDDAATAAVARYLATARVSVAAGLGRFDPRANPPSVIAGSSSTTP